MNNPSRKLITWGPVSPLPFYRRMSQASACEGGGESATRYRSMGCALMLDPNLSLEAHQTEAQSEKSLTSTFQEPLTVMMDVESTNPRVIGPASAPTVAMPSVGDCFVEAFLTLENRNSEVELSEEDIAKLVQKRGQELKDNAEKEAEKVHKDTIRRKVSWLGL